LLKLSEYFETGPARVVSHSGNEHGPNPYFSGDLADLKTAIRQYYGPLNKTIAESLDAIAELKPALKMFGAVGVASFHQWLEQEVSKAFELQDLEMHKDLMPAHNRLRVEELVIDGRAIKLDEQPHIQGFRCYGIDPMIALEPVLAVLKSQARRYLPKGLYTRKLRWNHPYPSPWSPPDDAFPCVRLMDHYLVFGTNDPVDVSLLTSEGQICKAWCEAQEAVARLLLCTPIGTSVFYGDVFIPDRDLHAVLTQDGIASDLFEQGAKACLIVNLATWRTVEAPIFKENWEKECKIDIRFGSNEGASA